VSQQISDEQMNSELEQYQNDLSWVLDNYTALIEKYGNQFVAVFNKKVLSHAETIQQLTKELDTKFRASAHLAVIEFIYPEHPNFVLEICA
jgi:hypothetical protein